MNPTDRLYAGAFVLLWSSGFIGAELATRYAAALTVLNWRFLILAGPALAWVVWRRSRITVRDAAVHVAIGSLAQAAYLYGVVTASELGVAPGTSALIASLQPAVTAAAAFVALGQRVRAVQIGGLTVGFAGVALVVGADYSISAAPLWAFALPLGAMLCLVAGTILERRARPRSFGPVDALAVQFLTAAVAFAVLSGASGRFVPPADPAFWGAVAGVTFMAGLGGYGTYWIVVRRNGPTVAATLLYLTPPTTMVWAWLMFGSPMAATAWLGLAVTALGVAMALRGTASRNASATSSPPAAIRSQFTSMVRLRGRRWSGFKRAATRRRPVLGACASVECPRRAPRFRSGRLSVDRAPDQLRRTESGPET